MNSSGLSRLKITRAVYADLEQRAKQRAFLRQALDAVDGGQIEKLLPTQIETRDTLALHSSFFLRSPKSGKDMGECETIVVAGTRGCNAAIDEAKARHLLPLRYPGSDAYCTPQVMLALAQAGALSMDEAYTYLQAMIQAPSFRHEFARKSKAKWLNAASYYGPVHL